MPHDVAVPLPAGPVPLAAALGATLAEPLTARCAVPGFDTAAMDGYAVAGPGPWHLAGRLLAGSSVPAALPAGTAVEIATGAAMPAGADGVLPYEQAVRTASGVGGPTSAGQHVRAVGEECAAGASLLPPGTPVTSVLLGLAAATGHDTLLVRPRPRVLALVTGAELQQRGLPGPSRVRDAVGPVLPGLVAALGGELVATVVLGDDRVALAATLAAADADVVVTSGACSFGPADHLHAVLADAGARLLADGVACRPGHPQLLADLAGQLVVGLPGNPLAALVGALTLLGPLLAGLSDRGRPALSTASLAGELAGRPTVTSLVPARRSAGRALPVDYAGSAMLRGVATADGLVVLPPGACLPRGAAVEIVDLPG